MNLKKEDAKCKAVKVFNLVQKIAEKLEIHLILDIKKIKADKLKIKQLDSRITKQQSIGSRIKKNISKWRNNFYFYVKDFDYMIDFYVPKRKLAIEVDELGHKDRKQKKENTRQKQL